MREFLPETLADWWVLLAGVATTIMAAVGIAWRAVRLPLVQQINGLGERVKVVELSDEAQTTRLTKVEREVERGSFERHALLERAAKLETATANLLTAVTMNRETGMEENGEIRERLARIESKVDELRPRRN